MDLLFHMLIPVMLSLIAGVDRRKAFMLAPIAIIPDLDVLLMAHRVYLHTILIPTTLAIIYLLPHILKQRDLFNLPQPRQEIFLAALYYYSHLLLDFFPGPTAIFWPLSNVGYGLKMGITINQQSIVPTIQLHVAVVAERIQLPNLVTNVTVAASESVITAILLLAIVLLIQYKKKR